LEAEAQIAGANIERFFLTAKLSPNFSHFFFKTLKNQNAKIHILFQKKKSILDE
jgi:hypothetical protein